MSIERLAFYNFRKSFRNYFSMLLSLAFTVLILFNFVNLTYADTFRALGEQNKEYIDIIVRIVSFVLVCFMFFFVWYASNVFLTKRKKEIGIYIFMGLTNLKIGRLYMLEMILTGLVSLLFGIGFGMLTTWLFQMILLAVSDISIEIMFHFTWQPVFITAVLYVGIYAVFVLKGYVNIVRSSVLKMISAARQNEYVKTGGLVLGIKAILGILALIRGYSLAMKESGISNLGNLFGATVFVIIGTYLLFGGFLPILFQQLAKNKRFLYRKERNLWVNSVIFRMRKNYRTYAMTCILLTCSVTALAAMFAEKDRYDNIVHFRNTYTYQIISSRPDIGEKTAALIEKDNDIAYQAQTRFFLLDGSYFSHGCTHGILPFSEVKKLAEETGLEFPYEKLNEDEFISCGHIYLMSFITQREKETVEIFGRTYQEIDDTTVPYLGILQESRDYYIVSDAAYEELLTEYGQISPYKEELTVYNYRIKDIYHYEASLDELDEILENTEKNSTSLITADPESSDIRWIKIEYSLCIFMFLVFVLASGSILFMKLYNDAFEEKERYAVLKKIGISERSLSRAVARELQTAYLLPFIIMTVSSYFAVCALEKMMFTDLKLINLLSVVIILLIFALFYQLSLVFYRKNAGIV